MERALDSGIQAARDVLVIYLLLVNISLLPCLGFKSKIKHRKTVPSKMCGVVYFFLLDSSIHLGQKQT